ncbi:GtrA family protein [Nocardioides sp. KIGAM211]|uniref:GtrA family protein n=1 Tax=Nocardioides luti TaxID=2761101 RepID=A0A7X0VBN2_9ACTN|nr:GtrA family protein [Nocardioides luti]MBB6628949.1 GtrA family protein [Nocardioides luti]
MGSRWQRLLAEVGRFLTVGGVATIVAFVIFNFLVHGFNTEHKALLDDHVIVAYVLANTVGMLISYRGSRSWAFRDRPPVHADGGRTAFVIINLATMVLPIGCLAVSRNVLGLDDPYSDNISANVIGLFLGLVARFYLFRTFVFRLPVAHVPNLPELLLQLEEEGTPGTPLSGSTDLSTRGPALPPAP